jgi:D-3-phosphoglycerate dehydrogenase
MAYFVAVTDSPAGDDLSIESSVLAGMRVERVDWSDSVSLAAAVREADAIMCTHAPLDSTVIRSLLHCRVIARFGTGLDNIDCEVARSANIYVAGVHEYCTEEVANHTMALLLAWNRKILEAHEFVIQKRWNQRSQTTGNWGCQPLSRLSEQILGIWGLGRIGRAVARRASSFGIKILAYSRHADLELAREIGVELTTVAELLRNSDYVSLHLPLTPETRQLINSATIGLMKRGAVLINTSRGALVDEVALVRALEDGHLGGALLDVYSHAPLALEHPLRNLKNVILTPHIAFYSDNSYLELRRRTAEAVLKHLSGA